jgi:membrane-bound lytic murein transglycosylase D
MHARIRHLSASLALVATALVAGCSWQYLKPGASPSPATRETPSAPPAADAAHRAEAAAAKDPSRSPAESATAPISVWQSLAGKLIFEGDRLPQVRKQLSWYREQGSLLDEASARATPYLYFVMDEIEARGFPADLALLPIVESGYEPTVISRHGAAGLWQFMGGTGRRFGLSRSGWVDERLDITASTTAALDYLGTLSRRFDGDWLLAIAAYNAGWGNVERAIARNRRAGRPTDVWHLPLRGETHALIARVVALSEIYREPEAHGLDLPETANEPYFARVTLDHPTDLREFARRSGIEEGLFKRLNPGIRGWHTGPTAGQQILVPARLESVAMSVAEQMPASPVPAGQALATRALRKGTLNADGATYTVQSGDSLWLIARRFDTSVDALLVLNHINRDTQLDLGQVLKVRQTANAKSRSKVATVTPESPGKAIRYRVKEGDSLWTIAHKFKVTIRDLLAWNNLQPDPVLQPGQEIVLYRTV